MNLKACTPRLQGRDIYVDEQVILANAPEENPIKLKIGFLLMGLAVYFLLKK